MRADRANVGVEVPATASAEEAAAIVAGLRRFIADTTPTAVSRHEPAARWLSAARAEAVDRDPRGSA